MIDLYTWTTPNGQKPLIALEELGLPYNTHWVNIGKGEQLEPAYLKLNPNNKIPTLIDQAPKQGAPMTVFESGAILIYLADKTGQLLAAEGAERYAALQWLMFQMGGVGPMLGQLGHFAVFAKEKIPYAIERYTTEANRILKVLDGRLGEAEYLAGAYSIADIATFPWIRGASRMGIELGSYANVKRWVDAIDARPAVQRAMALKPA